MVRTVESGGKAFLVGVAVGMREKKNLVYGNLWAGWGRNGQGIFETVSFRNNGWRGQFDRSSTKQSRNTVVNKQDSWP